MDEDNQSEDFLSEIVSATRNTALGDVPSEDDSPKDEWWWRWLKFLSIIIVPAVVFGLIFLFGEYFRKNGVGSYSTRW